MNLDGLSKVLLVNKVKKLEEKARKISKDTQNIHFCSCIPLSEDIGTNDLA